MKSDWRFAVLAVLTLGVTACDGAKKNTPDAGCNQVTLTCTPSIAAECTGALTPVALPVPTAELPTGCAGDTDAGAPTSNAAPAGLALGESEVTFTMAEASCVTQVNVTDSHPPLVECETIPVLVGRNYKEDAYPPATLPAATDGCDPSPSVQLQEPPPDERGTFELTAVATDSSGNRSMCTLSVQQMDFFAPEGFRIVSAQLAEDESTDVTLGWSAAGPDVQELAIERSATELGAYEEVARFGAAALMYIDLAMPDGGAFYRIVAIGPNNERGGQSAPLEVHAVGATQYNEAKQTVAGIGFGTSLRGVVRFPVDLEESSFPLVAFLHGNHGNCRPARGDDDCEERTGDECTEEGFSTTPNAEGYVYLQETLAAAGYISVSISANALNCREDFIAERTALIVEHLRRWIAGSLPLDARIFRAADFERVSLVGHSRGGEAVSQVPSVLERAPIAGLALASVLAIGPTDVHDNTPSGVAYMALLPACDADVWTLSGAKMVDRGAQTRDGHTYAQLLMVGANHNFFNTEWRFDDNSGPGAVCADEERIGASVQRAALQGVLMDWLQTATTTVPPYMRNQERTPAWLRASAGRDVEMRWSYFAPERLVIDNFDSPLTTDSLDEEVAFAGLIAEPACTGSCAPSFVHATDAARVAWREEPASVSFGLGGLDASSFEAVSFRIASRAATINEGLTTQDLRIRVTDSEGAGTELLLSELAVVPHLYPGLSPLEVLSSVRVPVAALRGEIDVSSLATIELLMPVPGHTQGSIWISDLELSGP